MLLHIEEIQKQKDIRNYDMEGKEFEQDSEDRRFLILTVSENSRKVGQFCKLNEDKTRIQSAMIILTSWPKKINNEFNIVVQHCLRSIAVAR